MFAQWGHSAWGLAWLLGTMLRSSNPEQEVTLCHTFRNAWTGGGGALDTKGGCTEVACCWQYPLTISSLITMNIPKPGSKIELDESCIYMLNFNLCSMHVCCDLQLCHRPSDHLRLIAWFHREVMMDCRGEIWGGLSGSAFVLLTLRPTLQDFCGPKRMRILMPGAEETASDCDNRIQTRVRQHCLKEGCCC